MSTAFRGAPPPSGAQRRPHPVVAPAQGEVVELTILDEQILGTECHWVVTREVPDGRSRSCTKEIGDCPYCGKHRELWLGWLAVYGHGLKRREILRMGLQSAHDLAALGSKHGGLRGLRVEAARVVAGHTSRLHFARSQHPPVHPLPLAHEMDFTLSLVLGGIPPSERRLTPEEMARLEVPS